MFDFAFLLSTEDIVQHFFIGKNVFPKKKVYSFLILFFPPSQTMDLREELIDRIKECRCFTAVTKSKVLLYITDSVSLLEFFNTYKVFMKL